MEIQFEDVNYTYQAGTPFENRALYDVDLIILDGSYTAIVGHTGSGKSTILQHLNALKKPTDGTVKIGDRIINSYSNNKGLKDIRKQVGIVFQFPEAQLFEETIELDIAFGPKNFGKTGQEAKKLASKMLNLVGLDDSFLQRSPFDLSGGQMRRVAIAGVLALEPDVLVLDEPTAGLDPKGRQDIMEMFYELNKNQGITVVLVTHQMEDVANYADHMIVLEGGTVQKEGSPREIFKESGWLSSLQLGVPNAVRFANTLEEKFDWQFDLLPLTTEELAEQIAGKLGQKAGESYDG